MDLAAGAGQRLRQHGADRAVVVSDKNGAVHQSSPRSDASRRAFGATGSDRRNTVRPGTEFDRDPAAMVGDDLRDQRQPKPGAVLAPRDEGVEDVGRQ